MRLKGMSGWVAPVIFILLLSVFSTSGCPPLPMLLYPVEEVYTRYNFPIPVLPDDAIAVIDGEYLPKTDYKKWLYRKIGFEPEMKKSFLISRELRNILTEKGVDVEKELNLMLDHFFYFEVSGRLYESTDAWHEQTGRLEGVVEHDSYRAAALPRIKEAYPKVFYLIQNWDDIHANVLEARQVAHDAISVSGDDPELQHVLRLLNALFVLQRLETVIEPYMAKQVLAGQDLNIPDYTEEYIDWLYAEHNTKFLVENYLGMVLSGWYAETNELEISEEAAQQEFALRVREYEELVNSFNRRLPASAVPLEISPVYTDYIMEEVRDDFRKSRAHRRATPLPEHQLIKRYYAQYGYNGVRDEVREIFKWVRRRRVRGRSVPGYAEYVAAEEARIRQEMHALRERIIADGAENFPIYALSATAKSERQQTSGRVDLVELYGEAVGRWGEVRAYTDKLESLALHEVSPVMKGPWNTIDIYWVTETPERDRAYYVITEELPPITAFDFTAYQENLESARNDLEALKRLIKQGASMEDLAQEHSDSYRRSGVDISDTYQDLYGYNFAKQVLEIPEGELGIIQTGEGLHLVQVVSRTYTPLTDEVRDKIVQQYNEELANQDDRYSITTRQLFRAHPYFRTTE